MPLESERIRQEIEEINSNFLNFLKKLENPDIVSREDFISNQYYQLINAEAQWLKESNNHSISSSENSQFENTQSRSIEEVYIERIEKTPNQKSALIKEFLEQFNEISTADRAILQSNFNEIPLEALKQEFLNLCEIFQKK